MNNALNEKALEYVRAKEKPSFYEAGIRGYIAGYVQAQSEYQYKWHDPRKELPECVPGQFVFVLASIGRDTEIVEYIRDGSIIKWRRFREHMIIDLPTSAIKAWMPLPHYFEE